MLKTQLQGILEAAGIGGDPAVARFYRDGKSVPSIVVQRDVQGCRILLRPAEEPDSLACAWFDDAGSLIAAEVLASDAGRLDERRAGSLLGRLLAEPLGDLARELVPLPG